MRPTTKMLTHIPARPTKSGQPAQAAPPPAAPAVPAAPAQVDALTQRRKDVDAQLAALQALKEKGALVAGIHAVGAALEKVGQGAVPAPRPRRPGATAAVVDAAAHTTQWHQTVTKTVGQLRDLEKQTADRIAAAIAKLSAERSALEVAAQAAKLAPPAVRPRAPLRPARAVAVAVANVAAAKSAVAAKGAAAATTATGAAVVAAPKGAATPTPAKNDAGRATKGGSSKPA